MESNTGPIKNMKVDKHVLRQKYIYPGTKLKTIISKILIHFFPTITESGET